MSEVTIPATAYSVRQVKPNNKYGAPGSMPVGVVGGNNTRMLLRFTLDKVPVDGTITSAKLRLYVAKGALPGAVTVRARDITSSWSSSATWNKQPTYGTVAGSQSQNGPPAGTLYELDVTARAVNRSRLGMVIDTTAGAVWLAGSSASFNAPVLVVTYSIIPSTPGNRMPDGGVVSDPKPWLTYAGEDDMTQQRIEYSTTGALPASYDTGFIPATSGLYVPDAGAPALAAGAFIYWRATTNGPNGQSAPSPWSVYWYSPLPALAVTNPPDTTDDGSPTLQWTTPVQTSWRAEYWSGGRQLETSGWRNEPATRDWTPKASIPVPGGQGEFRLWTRDDQQRVSAANASTTSYAVKAFTTAIGAAGGGITNLAVTYDDPIPVLTGTRAAGIPDLIGLFRDGIQVTLWDPVTGQGYGWAPAANFFTGQNFTLRDYSSPSRHEHVWEVRTKVGAVLGGGQQVTAQFHTENVWLVDPDDGTQVAVYGLGDVPAVEQSTVENSILHTPVHGDLIVEPVRRRLMRTTRSGSVAGAVANRDGDLLEVWAERDSGHRYRLIFGIVNWPIIMGDYSPADVFYPDLCGPDRTQVSLNWWQRLQDY